MDVFTKVSRKGAKVQRRKGFKISHVGWAHQPMLLFRIHDGHSLPYLGKAAVPTRHSREGAESIPDRSQLG